MADFPVRIEALPEEAGSVVVRAAGTFFMRPQPPLKHAAKQTIPAEWMNRLGFETVGG